MSDNGSNSGGIDAKTMLLMVVLGGGNIAQGAKILWTGEPAQPEFAGPSMDCGAAYDHIRRRMRKCRRELNECEMIVEDVIDDDEFDDE